MMRATEALELHADLIAKVSDVRVKSVMSSHLVLDSGQPTPAREAESKRIIENLEFTVKNCETRWIVRGFWRWQPYKEENGEWARKRIWIDPYIKGPAGAPLKITKKVNAVVR